MISMALTLLYISIAEYALHRWAMHRHVLGRNSFWREHAVEHHHEDNIYATLNLPQWLAHSIALPLYFAISFSLGLAFVVGPMVCVAVYAFSWTALHRAIHGVDSRWVTRLPGYGALSRHHMAHHANPRCNFATLFPIMDRLFGTAAK